MAVAALGFLWKGPESAVRGSVAKDPALFDSLRGASAGAAWELAALQVGSSLLGLALLASLVRGLRRGAAPDGLRRIALAAGAICFSASVCKVLCSALPNEREDISAYARR